MSNKYPNLFIAIDWVQFLSMISSIGCYCKTVKYSEFVGQAVSQQKKIVQITVNPNWGCLNDVAAFPNSNTNYPSHRIYYFTVFSCCFVSIPVQGFFWHDQNTGSTHQAHRRCACRTPAEFCRKKELNCSMRCNNLRSNYFSLRKTSHVHQHASSI